MAGGIMAGSTLMKVAPLIFTAGAMATKDRTLKDLLSAGALLSSGANFLSAPDAGGIDRATKAAEIGLGLGNLLSGQEPATGAFGPPVPQFQTRIPAHLYQPTAKQGGTFLSRYTMNPNFWRALTGG